MIFIEPTETHFIRVLEHSLELELADGRDLSRQQAKSLFAYLSQQVEIGEHAAHDFVPHHEEDGHTYPARLSVWGISAREGDDEFRAEVELAINEWVPEITIMGTGVALVLRPKPRVV